MNYTHAKSKFKVRGKSVELHWGERVDTRRVMVSPKSALTLPPVRKEHEGDRARRHRLNPGRRTVEQNRAAR